MTPPVRSTRHSQPGAGLAARCGSAGGYVFLIVLVFLVVASIITAAALRRAGMQAVLAEDQFNSYLRHHELQGVRAIADVWLLRNDAAELEKHANTGEPVTKQLVEDTLYRIYVQDGQGTVLNNLIGISGSVPQTWLVEMLSRLPPDRPDLTRAVGPWQLSLRAAPDEVLEAMAGGDPALAIALRQARDDEVSDASALIDVLQEGGADVLAAQAIARNVTFKPSLWRIDIEVERIPDPIRRYVLLVEKARNLPRTLEWRALDRGEAVVGFGPLGGKPESALRGPASPRLPKTTER